MQLYKLARFFGVTFTIIILVIIGHYTGLLSPVERAVLSISSPMQRFFFNKSQDIVGNRSSTSQSEVISELERKNNDLVVKTAQFNIYKEENDELRKQLDFANRIESTLVMAHIIGQSTDEISNARIIDKGEKSGIKVGYPVTVGDGIIIGKVIRTTPTTSTILTLTDNTSKIAATVQNNDKTTGIITGNFNISMNMELIPQNEKVLEDDIVITSGLEEDIPYGLVVGTIQSVSFDSGELFQTAVINPQVNYNTLRIVSILIPLNTN